MKIGIVGSVFENTFGVRKTYMEWLTKYFPSANIVVLAPDSFQPNLDLLILPGGRDIIDSKTKPGYHDGHADPWFEYFDKTTLPLYVDINTPIFGICRGFQTLCHKWGLKVVHNVRNHPFSQERDDLVHYVLLNTDSKNMLELESNIVAVNSLHHQGIAYQKELPDGFKIVAQDYYPATKSRKESIKGNLIEAFIIPEKHIAGVQYHPEEIYDQLSLQLLLEILKNE